MINAVVLRQLVVFGLVGVAATLTHYLVALGSVELLRLNIYLSNLFGYLCAVAVSYFGHGKLTFRVALNQHIFRRFVIVSVAAFCGSAALLAALEQLLNLPHWLSLAFVVAIVPIISFLLNKFWVYRIGHQQQEKLK